MKISQRKAPKRLPLAFWDTSAIVPLCGRQRESGRARQASRSYGMVVWWATTVEAASALFRLRREGGLTGTETSQAIGRLDQLRTRWNEITPTDAVRDLARRLLALHKLRAGDALQLAAALDWCSNRPHGRTFIAGDGDLLGAADAEGFTCIQLK